jgi:hypothetical protein
VSRRIAIGCQVHFHIGVATAVIGNSTHGGDFPARPSISVEAWAIFFIRFWRARAGCLTGGPGYPHWAGGGCPGAGSRRAPALPADLFSLAISCSALGADVVQVAAQRRRCGCHLGFGNHIEQDFMGSPSRNKNPWRMDRGSGWRHPVRLIYHRWRGFSTVLTLMLSLAAMLVGEAAHQRHNLRSRRQAVNTSTWRQLVESIRSLINNPAPA